MTDYTKLTATELRRRYSRARKIASESTGYVMQNAVREAQAIDMELANRKHLRKRSRAKNPRMQNMFVLLATRGKTVLKYVGGVRFSTRGRAVLFPSRADATRAARDLRARFPILKGYTLRVQS